MLNYMRIKRNRKYLTQDAAETLVLLFVISHLDYCNVILHGIANSDIKKMQRIQNMCAKLVLQRKKYDSSKQALFDLHWLPIKARINHKILTFMYQCTVGNAPVYLTELLSKEQHRRTGLRSSESSFLQYSVPRNKRKTFGDRSFSTIGPKLWNKLPLHVRQSTSVETFKKALKTFYFSDFFSWF